MFCFDRDFALLLFARIICVCLTNNLFPLCLRKQIPTNQKHIVGDKSVLRRLLFNRHRFSLYFLFFIFFSIVYFVATPLIYCNLFTNFHLLFTYMYLRSVTIRSIYCELLTRYDFLILSTLLRGVIIFGVRDSITFFSWLKEG